MRTFPAVFAIIAVISFISDAQSWSEKIARSIMANNPGRYGSGWDYVTGTVLRGFIGLYESTSNKDYYDYIRNTIDYSVNTNGTISMYSQSEYNIDMIKEGCAVLYLYKKTGAKKYKTAADALRKQLSGQPRTSDGGFWHKKKYPYQMWLDGLYMAEPFYAEYSTMFNSANDFDDIAHQFLTLEKHARDSLTGLLYHGWDEHKAQSWADKTTGCSKSFWGRGVGWYIMAIVEVLDFMPLEHPARDSLIAVLQRLTTAIADVQDSASGCWFQVLDQGKRSGNYLESSVSCMFVYAIAKSVRLKYIDDAYLDIAQKGYAGIISRFISAHSGKYDIVKTCCSAGLSDDRDGSFNYYINETTCTNDGKALGPFILASLEMENTTNARYKSSTAAKFSDGIELHQGFGKALLHFSLERSSRVTIALYSLNAHKSTIIENVPLPAGRYEKDLHIDALCPGLYIIHFQDGNRTAQKRVIVR